MDERGAGVTTDPTAVSEAYSTARQLLLQAEADAARIRADADRYKRQREQEAELLVAKARRLLTMAEERAATISRGVIELDGPTPAPAAEEPEQGTDPSRLVRRPQAAPLAHSALDSILATAVSNAVHRALPDDD
jgi:hypothetical protein